VEVYDNFHVAPLDEPPTWEGDDHAAGRPRDRTHLPEATRFLHAATTPTLIVPYRPAEPGDVGNHVYALKRMHARFRGGGRLAALMVKPPSVRRTWSRYTGPGSFYRDFKETRRLLGLTGPVVYDDAAWRKLARFADDFTLSLLVPKVDAKIDSQVAWLMALYNRRYQISYSQARPSELGRASSIDRADCSGSIAGACDWANVLPQVDWRWTNTDTQILMGTNVAMMHQAKRGDVVFYGSGGNPSHEAFYLGGSRVWSFGSYPIKLLDVAYRGDRIAIRRFVPQP